MEIKAFAGKRVYVDTNILVYFFEKHPEWFAEVMPLFEMAARGEVALVTSEFTVAELLVRPFSLGRSDIVVGYKRFLKEEDIIELVPLSLDVLEAAAASRASLGGTLADAMHVATASIAGCSMFVSNDREIRVPLPMQKVSLGSE